MSKGIYNQKMWQRNGEARLKEMFNKKRLRFLEGKDKKDKKDEPETRKRIK